MSKSVVIFGMAHSGKSTLMGFLIANQDHIDIDELEKKLSKQYGENYDGHQVYAYIVNTFKDEVKKTNNNSGSTKSLHLRRLRVNDDIVTIIDTPGVEHKDKERTKGMFYSDIGVFCIELSHVMDDSFFNNNRIDTIIQQLMLWTHFKKDVIILLTKSDMVNFNEEHYITARKNICDLCEMIDLRAKIIPISINVKTRNSHNILTLSTNKMPWYMGESFCDVLNTELTKVSKESSNELLFYVDRQYKKSKSFTGKSWRIKILKGNLNKGDQIILSPVKIGNDMVSVSCKVKTIRYDINASENIEELETVGSGNFVGIDVSNIKVNNKTISKEQFDALYTTCGFSSANKYVLAKYAIVEVEREYSNLFIAGSDMKMMWFGRTVGVKVISSAIKKDKIEIAFEMISRLISLPYYEQNLAFTSIIIDTSTQKYTDSFMKAQNTFIDAKLLELKEEI